MATNRMKALYTIMLPKRSNVPGIERTTEEVNEERLNDNFRTIVNELVKLWEGGEHNLNVLSARIMAAKEVTDAEIRDIIANVEKNSAAIVMMPDGIKTQVSEMLEGYATTGEVDENGDAVFEAAKSYTDSTVSQTASDLTVLISQNDLSSWVRIIGDVAASGSNHATNAGVIIGKSTSDVSLKEEAKAIFFYKGEDKNGWWPVENESNPNVLAGFDSNGSLVAGSIHNESMLLSSKFDIDVVSANGVDFLHITGRS